MTWPLRMVIVIFMVTSSTFVLGHIHGVTDVFAEVFLLAWACWALGWITGYYVGRGL